jgi:hypothetical protein
MQAEFSFLLLAKIQVVITASHFGMPVAEQSITVVSHFGVAGTFRQMVGR